jgi:hypothetical protein
MKPLLITYLVLVSVTASSQQTDFFLLKHSGRTVRSFFAGSYIDFATIRGESHSGYIKKVANDSVWVENYQILKGYTMFGGAILDTMTFQAMKFAVKDITAIHKEKLRLEQTALPVLLKIGSAGYILLHIVNGIILKQNINFTRVGIAAAVYLVAVLIQKLRKEYYHIGKKYTLQYMSLSAK